MPNFSGAAAANSAGALCQLLMPVDNGLNVAALVQTGPVGDYNNPVHEAEAVEDSISAEFSLAIKHVQDGDVAALWQLVDTGLDVTAASVQYNMNLAWVAAGHGRPDCLRMLAEVCGIDYLRATRGKVASTVAHAAALQGHCACIIVLGQLLGPQFLGVANHQGDTPAHFSVSFPNNHDGVDMINALHSAGAGYTLHVKDKRGFAPVHWAVKHGLIQAVRLLASLGCNVMTLQHSGETAAHTACLNGQPGTLLVLVELVGKAIVTVPESVARLTPAHAAAQRGALECLEVIAEVAGEHELANPDNNGRTPAHHAAGYNQSGVLRMLVVHGLTETLWAKDKAGHVPADFAKMKGHTEVVAFLEEMKPHQAPAPPKHRKRRTNASRRRGAHKNNVSQGGGGGGEGEGGYAAAVDLHLAAEAQQEQQARQYQLSMARYEEALAEATRMAKPTPLSQRQKKDRDIEVRRNLAAASELISLVEQSNARYEEALSQAMRAAMLTPPVAARSTKKRVDTIMSVSQKQAVLQTATLKECVFCLEACRAVCLLPCSHYIYCQACAEIMLGEPCSICRVAVDCYDSFEGAVQKGVLPIYS